jgi:uncharacterized protein YbaR (Trm112 family)
MAFDKRLLDILCCPVTHAPLTLMGKALLADLNRRIGEREIVNQGREVVAEPLENALVTRDGRVAYPVRDGIPILLAEEGIALGQLDAAPG